MAQRPLLYSFRRCPYAMRARMSIVRMKYQVEHREVILRDRPTHMMEISPKGTVPVLLLEDGTVIEESLEIMQHVLNWTLSEDEQHWISRNDDEFKFHLDRYKYPNRYEGINEIEQRSAASSYLRDLNVHLESESPFSEALSDALFPFVRQFANHNRDWFDAQDWNNIHSWLAYNLDSEAFKACMKKHKQWHEGDDALFFPSM
ncbi:MAG: glutathione S-transferase [Euryarchaeota archaeon]|nr:glutathione S-transferase [Euryarchaeota archaeon]MBT7262995.1 glutathione S-transferase [Euryarchaeota archaeon]MBT7637407.1 glutathione S-transferase [Euryarchaeota archaeon]